MRSDYDFTETGVTDALGVYCFLKESFTTGVIVTKVSGRRESADSSLTVSLILDTKLRSDRFFHD